MKEVLMLPSFVQNTPEVIILLGRFIALFVDKNNVIIIIIVIVRLRKSPRAGKVFVADTSAATSASASASSSSGKKCPSLLPTASTPHVETFRETLKPNAK